MTQPAVQLTQPRATVQVRWPDGRLFEAPVGAALESFVRVAHPGGLAPDGAPIVAALLDGRLRELSYPLHRDADAQLITMASDDGMKIYRRGLTFLMVAAAAELFADAEVEVDHSIQSGGYFCMVHGRDNFTEDELARLATRMRILVEANLPIVKEPMPLAEAIAMFRARGDDDKVKLLEQRTKDYLVIYRLGHFADYFHGYMVPASGYLRWFDLESALPGFLLRFPQRSSPTAIQPRPLIDRLLVAFREYGDWLDRLGISNVGSLNEAIRQKRIRELVLVSEALHEQRIAQIATWVAEGGQAVRLIL
ncbi:MAG TPA: nucleoside kinase, partial [Anaerolineales bacterium]|nr:nucleoside kinase [Anaerolineales bacterium]